MNKIYKLFDEKFISNFFDKEVLPLYPDFKEIKKIKIIPHKKLIWEKTYHVVVEFKTYLSNGEKTRIFPIFCSAHSDEPRHNVYRALEYLWSHSFASSNLTIPRPLFYNQEFRGTFYQGVEGNNLYHYIKSGNRAMIEETIVRAAAWFYKLHNLPAAGVENFNQENSRIKTVFPGFRRMLRIVRNRYPEYEKLFKIFFDKFSTFEKIFLMSTDKRWLIHGDAHPENIIRISREKTAVIDFTDICLSDFARDLGCFLQQLEFMIMRKIGEADYAQKVKDVFLKSYLENAKIELSINLLERINNYYNWTAVRTAIFFLTKAEPEPDRAVPLIKTISKKLGIKII